MPYATVNGVNIHYEARGDPRAPGALFIPGLGGSHRDWEPVAERLRAERRFALVDPRDAGRSGRAQGPYGIGDMAADIAGLAAALGYEQWDVVGFSMGGAIAQELAIGWEGLVRRLVLIATYDGGDLRGTAIFRHLAHLRRVLSREDYHRLLLPWVYTWREFGTAMDPEETVKRLCEEPLFQEAEAYERQAAATVSFESRGRLGRIGCPTLLIFGDEDLFTPMRFARSLEAGIPGSRLVVLSGAGHGLLWTRSAEVAALIDGWLA